jgi:hypothetical protein
MDATTGAECRPSLAERRRLRRAQALTARLDAARTPADRISVAAGYLRGALKYADPVLAKQIADRVVEQLVRYGHDCWPDDQHEQEVSR